MPSVSVKVGEIVADIRVKVQDKRVGNLLTTSLDSDICRFMVAGYNRLWRKHTQAIDGVSVSKKNDFLNAVAAAVNAETDASRLDINRENSDIVEAGRAASRRLADREVPMVADFRYLLASSAALETESIPKQGVQPVAQIPAATEEQETPVYG